MDKAHRCGDCHEPFSEDAGRTFDKRRLQCPRCMGLETEPVVVLSMDEIAGLERLIGKVLASAEPVG